MLPFPSRDVRGCDGAPQYTTNYLSLLYVYISTRITPGHRICFPTNREAVTFSAAIGRAAPRLLPGLSECECVRASPRCKTRQHRASASGGHTHSTLRKLRGHLNWQGDQRRSQRYFFFCYFYCCRFCSCSCSITGLIWTFNESNLREKKINQGLDCSSSAQFYIATAVNVVLDYFARMCF